MRIQKLKIRNILGAVDIDIAPKSAIVMVAGPNNAGKSSIYAAITAAFTGDMERVALKKDLHQAVNEGQKSGSVAVTTDIGTVTFEVPTGKAGEVYNESVKPELIDKIKYCIGAGRFTAMNAKERKQFLMDITGTRMSVTEVEARLLKRENVTEAAAADLIPVVREKGFEVASKIASEHATQTKGRWREVTGENWGAAKAVNWKMAVPEVDLTQLAVVRAAVKQAQAQVKAANDAVEQLKGAQAAAQREADRLAQTKANLRPLDEVEIERDDAIAAVRKASLATAAATNALNELPEPAVTLEGGVARVPTPELRGAFITIKAAHHWALETGHHDVGWVVDAAPVIDQYNTRYESTLPVATAKDEALVAKRAAATSALRAADAELEKAERVQQKAEAAVVACKAAHETLAQMADKPVATVEGSMPQLLTAQTNAEFELNAIIQEAKILEAADLALQEADKKNRRAAALHLEVLAYDTCAKALAPDGIPGEIVGEALEPMNKHLRDTAELAGWPQVSIAPDMGLLYGTRSQALCSESEKWRIDAMVTAAIATQTGVRFVMLDRVDVLNVENRGKLMMWLRRAVQQGKLEGAVLFGTLKERPKLPEGDFSPYWIESGRLV